MFRDLKPYDAYRASGTPWLPSLPLHWQSPRLKTVLTERNVRGFPAEPLLAATQSQGVIQKSDYATRTVTAQKDFDLLKLVEVGDFVISLRSFQGGIERAYARGIISPAYTILEARDQADADYLTLLFKSRPFVDALTLTVTGIREGQNIEYPRLARDVVPLPSREEQAAIVKYLAHAHARIDRAVAAKRKLIALLEEQKQAIINQAVTRGLDPTVPMKDPGVPWLEKVPESWRVLRVKSTIGQIGQGWSPQCDAQLPGPGEWGVLKAGCVNHGTFRPEESKRLRDGLAPKPELQVEPGDVLVSRANTLALVGSAALVMRPAHRLMISDKTFRFRVSDPGVLAAFLVLALRSSASRAQIEAAATGASFSMQNIGQNVVRELVIAVPPAEEQHAIVGFVDSETTAVHSLIDRTRREIALLGEFRTRITSDVVTGQLDVREIASTLPDLLEQASVVADSAEDESLEVLDDVLEEAYA